MKSCLCSDNYFQRGVVICNKLWAFLSFAVSYFKFDSRHLLN